MFLYNFKQGFPVYFIKLKNIYFFVYYIRNINYKTLFTFTIGDNPIN